MSTIGTSYGIVPGRKKSLANHAISLQDLKKYVFILFLGKKQSYGFEEILKS